jgi:hypothetical protein
MYFIVLLPGPAAAGAVEPYLNCSYSLGPGAHVNANEDFTSFRVMSLALDSDELERQALSGHRTTQLLAPHTTENPVFFHATDVTASGFTATIDQMAETGFEMLIFSFGSGFRLESADPAYLATIKKQIDYAHSKGIEVGGYDLICLDRGNPGKPYGEDWSCQGDTGEAVTQRFRLIPVQYWLFAPELQWQSSSGKWRILLYLRVVLCQRLVRQIVVPCAQLHQQDGPVDAGNGWPVRWRQMRIPQPQPSRRPRGLCLPPDAAPIAVLR